MIENKGRHGIILPFLYQSLEVILIIILVFIFLNIFLAQLLVVTGDSMYPTLKDQEQILGEKLSVNFIEPRRGEIFIFRQPITKKLLIKRLIGLPGENILISKGKIYINGIELEENYLDGVFTKSGNFIREDEVVRVPEGKYLFLGDNREKSLDGREWGFTSKEDIESKAFLVYFPTKNFRLINKQN